MEQKSPNILLIISDQHHPRFLGCAGEPLVHTPHLDSLAARGTQFTRAYCNFPLCCPSRMSFLTARQASDIDCLSNASQLGSDVPTFAHAFNAAGYQTVLCGRMHFNGADQRHGFQQRIVGDVVSSFGAHGEELRRVLGPELCGTTGPQARAIVTSGAGYSGYQAYDEKVAATAADWLRHHAAKPEAPPFMLVVGLVLPHAPFVATPDDFARYDDKIDLDDLPAPHPETLHPALRELQRRAGLEDAEPVSTEDQRRARVAYYGMCTQVDRLVGDVLGVLEEAGLSDDTIVVYTSDHGEQLGEHGMWWKHSFYEASVGVPLLLAGPGIPQGRVEQNVSLLDIGPTLLDLAGAPALPEVSGESFRCLLEGRPEAWHDTVIAENLWPPNAPALHRMIKQGPWKLCYYPGQGSQLFNLDDDPQELVDRIDDPECRSIRENLLQQLLAGWDHESIMAHRQNTLVVDGWTTKWREQCDLADPDPPWYDTPPVNTVNH